MPLQKLQFRPGVNRESTTLANEGGWFETEKVRFRSGFPEKIGGWTTDTGDAVSALKPPTPSAPSGSPEPNPASFWGTCRALWNWITLANFNLLALGTNLKYYIQNSVGGGFFDVTPIRAVTAAGDVTFSATPGSDILTVNDIANDVYENDFVTFSGAVGLGGDVTAAILNQEFQVYGIVSADVYQVRMSVTATVGDVGNGGAAVVATYQIHTGADVSSSTVGWGAGGWGGLSLTGGAPTAWNSSTAPVEQLRLWSQSNLGSDLIFNYRTGPLYLWVQDSTASFPRAQQLSPTNNNYQDGVQWWKTDVACPTKVNYVLISDQSNFTIALGANDPSGVSTNGNTTDLDPMLIRWSDAENPLVWEPDPTNLAGFYRLSTGSYIVTGLQTRQEILVWTDAALYSLQYIYPAWQPQIMGSNISIVGPNAAITVNNVTYWMGTDKFYMYSGRVETLPCALRQYVFEDINYAQNYQVFAGTNEGYNEIWWFYCSANSTLVNKYVIYNYLERTWYYGTMARTAWLDSPLRAYPMAAGYYGQLIYHEDGVDDGTTNPPLPIDAYCQSADFDIGDGHNYGFVWRLIPDITFDGSVANQPQANFTVRPRTNPGANYGPSDNPKVQSTQNYAGQRTYNVQQFTQQVFVRLRGRQMAFRVESNTTGVAWQLGAPRIDVRPDGRR